MELETLLKRSRLGMFRQSLAPLLVVVVVAAIGLKLLTATHADTGGYYLGANGQEFNPITAAYTGQLVLKTSSGTIIPWQSSGQFGGTTAYSPDGSKLLVLSSTFPRFVVLANADGSNAETLLTDTRANQTQAIAFSPDSSKFAVLDWLFTPTGNSNGLKLSIYTVNGSLVSSATVKALTAIGDDGAEGFAWSPNGQKLVILGPQSIIYTLESKKLTYFNLLPTPLSSPSQSLVGWTNDSQTILFSSMSNTRNADGSTNEVYSLSRVTVPSSGIQTVDDYQTIVSYTTPTPQTSHTDLIYGLYDAADKNIYYQVPNGSAAGLYVTNLKGSANLIAPSSTCQSYGTNDIAMTPDGQDVVFGCDDQASPEDLVWSASQHKIVVSDPAMYHVTDNGSYRGSWHQ